MQTLTLPEAVKGMTDATILRWLKPPGGMVAAGETIAEAQTRREVIAIQSPAAGRLAEILAAVGKTVAVGQPIARLQGESESAAVTASRSEAVQAAATSPAPAAGAPPSGVVPILMPKAGNTMEEGTIVAWRVKEGQRIEKGQVLFEVETDKAVVEVEADAAGRVAKIVVGEGESAAVLVPVAYMAENDAEVESFLRTQGGQAVPAAAPSPPAGSSSADAPRPSAAQQRAATPTAAVPGTSSRAKASPAARKAAGARGIELSVLPPGSGPDGRILSTDVPAVAPTAGQAGGDGVIRRPLSRIRKAIARSLAVSKQTVPHFYIELTIDAAPMMDFYRQEKAKYHLSLNDVILHACAAALMEFPAFRRRLEGDQYAEYPSANIGVAIALEDGLVVPIVQAAEKMTLEQTGAHMRKLVEAARAGRVDNAGNGVMTISNLGMFGTERFSAIINPPEASILAVGTLREEPVVENGTIRPGRRMTMTLSCDHRVVDGAAAAQFLARLKELLEQPQHR